MTVLRENIESQLSELEFVQSLYDSVKISPQNIREEFQAFIDGALDDVYNQLTCLVVVKDTTPPVEVEVTLPHCYPHSELSLQTHVRGGSAELNRIVRNFVTSLRDQHDLGTYCISFVVDYVSEQCANSALGNLPLPTDDEESRHLALDGSAGTCGLSSEVSGTRHQLHRVWLISHHIYNKVKRRKLVELSFERSLGGFTLPGKPGVICLEGTHADCAGAVHIIKSWSWQKIGIKFEEKNVQRPRFNGVFEELTCYKSTQGAGERPHMDLGAFFKYLEEHDLAFAFHELFGVHGK